jgi:RimJ/RimL family protein N-acetyltransferase
MTAIETARLLLRPWQADDPSEFTRLLTDPVVTRYGELPMAGTVVAWYAIDRADWQEGARLRPAG